MAAAVGHVDAVVAADTPMLVLAAAVAARLGLRHNPVNALVAAADKNQQRRLWADAGIRGSRHSGCVRRRFGGAMRSGGDPSRIPCVVKAVSLSASQGILRADDPDARCGGGRADSADPSHRSGPTGGWSRCS